MGQSRYQPSILLDEDGPLIHSDGSLCPGMTVPGSLSVQNHSLQPPIRDTTQYVIQPPMDIQRQTKGPMDRATNSAVCDKINHGLGTAMNAQRNLDITVFLVLDCRCTVGIRR